MLEGANDAARDSIASFEMRLKRWLGHLEARRGRPRFSAAVSMA